MQIHGLRPELQPEAVNEKARAAAEANAKADKPVRGHDDVVPPVDKVRQETTNPNQILDVKG